MLYGILATPKPGTARQNYLLKLKGEVDSWLRSLDCVPPTEIDIDTPLSDPYRNGIGMIQLYNEVFCNTVQGNSVRSERGSRSSGVSSGAREPGKLIRPQSRAISMQVDSEYSRTLLAPETSLRPAFSVPSSVSDCKANLGRVVAKVLARENVPESIAPDAVEIARGNFVDTYILLLVFYINYQALHRGEDLSDIQESLVRHLEQPDIVLASLAQQERTVSRGKEEVKKLDGIRLPGSRAPSAGAAGTAGATGTARPGTPENSVYSSSPRKRARTPRSGTPSRSHAPCAEPFDENEVMQFLFNAGVVSKPYCTLGEILPGLQTGVLLCAVVSAVFTARVAPLTEDCRNLTHQTANIHRAFDYVRRHCRASLFQLRFMSQEANELRILRGEVQAAKDCLAELRGLYGALHPELEHLHRAAEVPSALAGDGAAGGTLSSGSSGKAEYVSEGLVRPPAEMQATQCPPRALQVFNGALEMADLPFSVREDLVLSIEVWDGEEGGDANSVNSVNGVNRANGMRGTSGTAGA